MNDINNSVGTCIAESFFVDFISFKVDTFGIAFTCRGKSKHAAKLSVGIAYQFILKVLTIFPDLLR